MIAVATRSLSDWLSYMETVHRVGIDLGLDRVRRVAQRLGVLPPAAENFVIAGTNGKGSTSVYLEALLRATGRRVGTTLSPHLSRFNERIRVDGWQVDDDPIREAFAEIDSARGDVTLTYFEFGVLAALWTFKRAAVDTTVLEVGLGGRLDAVNIVDADVATITSIGIDHVNYLGPDRESIGREKAGILRPRVPAVYGEASVPTSIVETAGDLDAPLLRCGLHFDARTTGDGHWEFRGTRGGSPITLRGLAKPSVALSNAATALQTFLVRDHDSDIEAAVGAAASARLPGRFEHFSLREATAIVDVAHNPHGAAFLADQLRATRRGGRTIAIAGFLQDKDAQGIVAALEDHVDEWIFVDTEGVRGQAAAMSAERARTRRPYRVAQSALAVTLSTVSERLNRNDRIVVVGCFDLAQRARAVLSRGVYDVD
jgi:dihydrofolate synthase/folylpolyglutamate synthase